MRDLKGQFVKGHEDIANNKGRKHVLSDLRRSQLRKAIAPLIEYNRTPERREKARKQRLGAKLSDESKDKLRKARLGVPVLSNRGNKNYKWKGGLPTCKEKGCSTLLSRRSYTFCHKHAHSGDKNGSWLNGLSRRKYPSTFNASLKLLIRTRDNFTCCLCLRTEKEEFEEFNKSLCVNHINFDKADCRAENLNTLCLRCNVKINKERDYWTKYFIAKV